MSGFLTKLSKEGTVTVRHCQSKEVSILWSHHEETRELTGERRDNARNNARCTMDNINTIHGQDSPWNSQSNDRKQ